MAYATRTQVKEYLGMLAGTTSEDDLLDDIIARVQAFVDSYTGRKFEVPADTTRLFDAKMDTTANRLALTFDHDLISITSITNGDGTSVTSDQYVLLPTNYSPKFAIRFKASANKYWTYEDDPEEAISIVGRWGYSLTAPLDVEQATIRLASYIYRQKDNAGEFDRTILAGNSTLLPTQIPRDVLEYLQPYIRYV
jgi:hypothetical protein